MAVSLTVSVGRWATLECRPCNLWTATYLVCETTFFTLLLAHRKCGSVG